MAETPDVLSQVGLGNIDQVIPHHQQRAVQKLFVKFSGLDAPEQAMTGEGFLRAVKSLNLPPAGSSDEYLHSVLTSCHSLYSRQMKPSDEVSPDAVLEREVKFIPFLLLFQHCFGDSCFWVQVSVIAVVSSLLFRNVFWKSRSISSCFYELMGDGMSQIVMDEMIYCLAVIGKKVLNKPESTSL